MDNDLKLLLIAGNNTHDVGHYLAAGAKRLGIKTTLLPMSLAFRGYRIMRSIWWRVARRPAALGRYQRIVLDTVLKDRPDIVLTTGLSPVTADTLRRLHDLGCRIGNYSTDDPWNNGQRAEWFLRALPEYDVVFTPRVHTAGDFHALGCKEVIGTMFAYAPETHINRASLSRQPDCEVAVIGGADKDRIPFAHALVDAGYRVGLWGNHWEKSPRLKNYARGIAPIKEVVSIVSAVPVNVCMVRHANRDSHCMRSFEIPVAPGAMVIERTNDHEELFGSEYYESITFSDPFELVEAVGWVLQNREKREEIKANLSERILAGQHTYQDRLGEMLTYFQTSH